MCMTDLTRVTILHLYIVHNAVMQTSKTGNHSCTLFINNQMSKQGQRRCLKGKKIVYLKACKMNINKNWLDTDYQLVSKEKNRAVNA